jgi:hypothetical protein
MIDRGEGGIGWRGGWVGGGLVGGGGNWLEGGGDMEGGGGGVVVVGTWDYSVTVKVVLSDLPVASCPGDGGGLWLYAWAPILEMGGLLS